MFLFGFLLLYAGRFEAMFDDSDTLWHLAAGRWMLAHGEIPRSDVWGFAAEGAPWRNLSWLFDVPAAWAVEAWGERGAMLGVVFGASGAAALAAWAARRAGAGVIGIVGVFWWVLLLVSQGVALRPQLVTYGFVLLWVALLRDGRLFRWKAGALAASYLLWVNMHGGFLLAWAVMGAYAIGMDKMDRRRLAVLVGLCAALTFATPWGWHIGEAVARTLGSRLTPYLSEWQPMNPMREVVPALFMLFALGLCAVGRKALRRGDVLLMLLGMGMAAWSVRHVPVMAVMSAIPLALALDAAVRKLPAPAAREADYARDMGRLRARVGLAALAAGVALWPVVRGGQATWSASVYPREAVAYLKTLPYGRVWNEYGYGGSLIYHGEGRLKPVIDGRAETAYPDAVVADYLRFFLKEEGWEALPERYGADAVLLPPGDAHAEGLEVRGWRRVAAVTDSVVLVRSE